MENHSSGKRAIFLLLEKFYFSDWKVSHDGKSSLMFIIMLFNWWERLRFECRIKVMASESRCDLLRYDRFGSSHHLPNMGNHNSHHDDGDEIKVLKLFFSHERFEHVKFFAWISVIHKSWSCGLFLMSGEIFDLHTRKVAAAPKTISLVNFLFTVIDNHLVKDDILTLYRTWAISQIVKRIS